MMTDFYFRWPLDMGSSFGTYNSVNVFGYLVFCLAVVGLFFVLRFVIWFPRRLK